MYAKKIGWCEKFREATKVSFYDTVVVCKGELKNKVIGECELSNTSRWTCLMWVIRCEALEEIKNSQHDRSLIIFLWRRHLLFLFQVLPIGCSNINVRYCWLNKLNLRLFCKNKTFNQNVTMWFYGKLDKMKK